MTARKHTECAGEEVNAMRTELTITELDTETAELLPARETLYYHSNWALVNATNSSMALNAGSFFSNAQSVANQSIGINQS
jgi:hypothetical protein